MKFSRDAAIPRIPAPHLLKQGQLQLAGASFRDKPLRVYTTQVSCFNKALQDWITKDPGGSGPFPRTQEQQKYVSKRKEPSTDQPPFPCPLSRSLSLDNCEKNTTMQVVFCNVSASCASCLGNQAVGQRDNHVGRLKGLQALGKADFTSFPTNYNRSLPRRL